MLWRESRAREIIGPEGCGITKKGTFGQDSGGDEGPSQAVEGEAHSSQRTAGAKAPRQECRGSRWEAHVAVEGLGVCSWDIGLCLV